MSIGRWATMAHAAPLSSPGEWVDRSDDWDLIVQVALIDATNVDGSPQPVWQDVTGAVIDIEWNIGDDNRESRLPVGAARIRLTRGRLVTLFGDPLARTEPPTINDRFGAGCLFRFGYKRASDGAWKPRMTGFVDTVREDWTPDLPGDFGVYELRCFDAMYYIAGYRNASTYSAVSGNNAWNAFDTLLGAIDWPFHWLTIGTTYPAVPVPPSPYQPPLGLLHRLADTMGGSMWAAPDGRLIVAGWDHRAGHVPFEWTVLDRNVDLGYGLAPNVILPTRMEWVNSMDRLLYRAEVTSPEIVGSAPILGRSLSPALGDRYRWRIDRAGWPKTDLLHTTPPPWSADDCAYRSREVTRCDKVTFDTQTAGRGGQQDLDTMIAWLSDYSALHQTYRVERRSKGLSGAFNELCTVTSVQGRIERTGNQHRLTVTHGLRWW
jgi:hypothetical protein